MILNFWNGEVFLDHTCNTHAHNSQAKSNVPHFLLRYDMARELL